jgi:hypothetical protein
MRERHSLMIRCLAIALSLLVLIIASTPVMAVGATTEIRVVKYAADGATVMQEETVTYEWLMDNLPVHGDGQTHYYHQGPIFEGDVWEPTETLNLKDKGAVMGTAVRDICELVGGMSPGDEIMFVAVDGWHTEFAYENIYEPLDRQGILALCWYNGEDALTGERYGEGYPGSNSYHTAIQMVFLAGTTNVNGEYVFGNDDMRICLPDERYQHFYEGLPSTNGLSGKWITEVAIYSGEAPVQPGEKLNALSGEEDDNGNSWLVPLIIGCVGVVIIIAGILILRRKPS